MTRALILLSLAALSLGGCSSKAKAPDGTQTPGKAPAAAAPAKPNPWNSDSADPAAPAPAANPAAKKTAGKAAAAPVNPWAKDLPPGSEPSPAPAAKAK